MSFSPAFFKTFYQNDTLFQLGDQIEVIPEIPKKVSEPVIPAVAQEPLRTVPVVNAATPPMPVPVQQAIRTFPPLNHKILILTDDARNKNLIGSEALLLDNILKAVGHASDKTDILNFSFLPGSDARQVLSEKRTNYFITFGVPLIKLHLDLLLVPYTPKLVEGIWFLLADPLVVIDADKALKKKLWLALQKMFEKL